MGRSLSLLDVTRRVRTVKITIDGLSIYYEIHGSGDPVLLVHGFPLSGRLWDRITAALSPDYRVIVPDLRGLGRSEASTSCVSF